MRYRSSQEAKKLFLKPVVHYLHEFIHDGIEMERSEIKKILDSLADDIESIVDEKIKSVQKTLVNLIEALLSQNELLREENQMLRNENNRLKGEQGKPTIRKQTQKNKNVSSEQERRHKSAQKRRKAKNKKRETIKVDRIETLKIDKDTLPPDAKFQGYESVFVQDISIKTNNVEFKKEVYYSKSLKQSFMAPLPQGYEGEFGPTLKALIMDLRKNMSQPAIGEFLTTHGVQIAPSTISRILIDSNRIFHEEKKDIVAAGLASSSYQQMDDTSARVNGKNYYTHVLCNPFYTAFFTRPNKDRLTIIEILTQGELMFAFNESAFSLMEQMGLSDKTLKLLREQNPNDLMNREYVDTLLGVLFPNHRKHYTQRQVILDACAIMAYRQLPHAITLLLTDHAPQYNSIVDDLATCWIHDGRHYKKLNPVLNAHVKIQQAFLDIYWDYYHQLLDYKKSPSAASAKTLSHEFDRIFSTKTSYDQLDARIEKTKMKKDSLLLVLDYPELPLHNNNSELGARRQARYRDISFQTKNKKGTDAKDTHMTITETAKKLAVNTFNYFYDRISGKYEVSSLGNLIKLRMSDYDPEPA